MTTLMPIRVLVVDDNAFVRRTLSLLIRESGFELCGEAEDGQAAVIKACELRPDLIIMDLVMPLMNGFEASKEISQRLPEARIILHTLHTVSEVDMKAKKNGISRVVPKSQGYSIVSVMHELVDSRSLSATPASAAFLGEAPLNLSSSCAERTAQSEERKSEANPSGGVARAS